LSDPVETPAQAIDRLRKEITQLKRLRAEVPMLILRPYVEDATAHIKEVAARLAVKGEVPAEVAAYIARLEAAEASKPSAPPTPPPEVPTVGTRVMLPAEKEPRGVTVSSFLSASSPKEWKVTVLLADGRMVTVSPEQLQVQVGPAAAASPAAPAPGFEPGSHVREKTTGKTGYVSEIADGKATVQLDEGGFVVRALADLEPV